MSKTWFITGSSRGFGREFVAAALARGDSVAATARDIGSLADIVTRYGDAVLPLPLDVTDKAAVTDAVQRAHAHFGRLDVVVNNAGYGLFGAVEEMTEQQVRDQFETNFFGALWVSQAVLPLLRAQGAGHIVQISTVGGLAAFPTLGGYNASKWALEGLSEALAQEVAAFGIKVTLVEPGAFATDWDGPSAVAASPLPAYDDVRAALRTAFKGGQGDPKAVGPALLSVVDSENPPLRVFFGAAPLQIIPHVYAERLKTWDEWADVARQAQGSEAASHTDTTSKED
ncbi:NAD(P)-dependent dehydrogenase (short-subunit alcohol dehydrogenase family) [Streptomyces sp. SAI-133]|uniref:SDR family oxidoreductase n=1 Tax=unclassified Streptomyces TaxID=2593676 RepID=UPI0024740863|nr:SDR family oxidoreductase [Streptomyces sp. SAI-133]MDH6590013.1 NAD(P)-dependent dehydrogenase (short-subunit alcohol dehydrogenase family) [Streptomyces sp. SAI-133]